MIARLSNESISKNITEACDHSQRFHLAKVNAMKTPLLAFVVVILIGALIDTGFQHPADLTKRKS